jgi:NAD+ kinase
VRTVVMVTHPTRQEAARVGADFAKLLVSQGVKVVAPDSAGDVYPADLVECRTEKDLLDDVDIVVVLGGDGTILSGAELARGTEVPLLGLNLGHVGFLAEAESNELSEVADAITSGSYRVERRLAIDVDIVRNGEVVHRSWALNEASLEKGPDTRMVDVLVSIDDHPLSRWGADGVVLATPTGSTAYAWSAGGPVVWPEVEALLVVPISAHALFARPLVISADSEVEVTMGDLRPQTAELWCDGRRHFTVHQGESVIVRRSAQPVVLARLHEPAFTERLVNKFHLPVEGWRGTRRDS